jgi:microcystin-dependent protein
MATNTTNFNWFVPTIGGDGDLWGDYWNSNINSQDSLIRRQMNNFINTTAPAEAQNGTFWVNNTTNPWTLSIFDGTDWISIGTINTTTNTFTVSSTSNYVGDIKNSVQTANHGSWLLCDGTSVSTSTYSGLFALTGYAFGGSGASFNLPDMRGRVAGAIGTGSGLTTRTLGNSVGEETHLLTIPEIPAHTHPMLQFVAAFGTNFNAFGVGGGSAGNATGSTGGGGAHNNMQPTLFTGNYFIFSGV